MEENGAEILKKTLDRIISQKEMKVDSARNILIEIINKNRELKKKTDDNLYLEILDREYELLMECLEALGDAGSEWNKEQPTKRRIVKIGIVNNEIPKFISKDNFELGPFKRGDIISIDEYDLNLLKEGKYLDIIEEEI